MATGCCPVDSHSRPSTLDKLVIAPVHTPKTCHIDQPRSGGAVRSQGGTCTLKQLVSVPRPSRRSTPARHSCGGTPAMTFNGLNKQYNVLAYGDHVSGGEMARRASSSHSQQREVALASPASHSNSIKIMPHITRPGTSCMRPPTSESLPVKGIDSQSTGQRSLSGIQAPEPSEHSTIRAVWTPGELMENHPNACTLKRIASCPDPVIAHASGETGQQIPALPVCRTAPVEHTCATSKGVRARSSGLRMHTMDTLEECIETDATVPEEDHIVAEADPSARRPPPQLPSHPIHLSECHTSHSTQTIQNQADGTNEEPLNSRAHETPAQRGRTATPICTPHSVSEFYASSDGPISAVNQSAPMVLSLVDFFQSSKEVIELEVSRMSESQLEQLEQSLDQAMQ